MSDEAKDERTSPPDKSLDGSSGAHLTVDDFATEDELSVIEHVLADAPPEVAYPALRHLDLLTVHSPMTSLATWVRDLPERWRRHVPPRVPTRLTFDDRVASGEWILLAERPGHEVVFGAVGKFWKPVVRWDRLSSKDEFLRFDRPRRCRVVLSLSVREYGRSRSVLSYDIRIAVRDSITRRVFALYWKTVAPFVKMIMRDTLRTAAAHTHARRAT